MMNETNRLELFWFLPTSDDGPNLRSSDAHVVGMAAE
jgi:hypothetical protein